MTLLADIAELNEPCRLPAASPWSNRAGLIYSGDVRIARVEHYDVETKRHNAIRAEANARLISAAPELLAAGRAVLASWESGDLAGAVRALGAAIRKAEGGQ